MTFTFIYKKGYCFSIKTTEDITFKALILLKIKNLDLNPGTTINWGSTSDKEPTSQCRSSERFGFHPWVGKIPWRRAWQPTAAFLRGESHAQRSLAGYSPRGRRESDMTEVT